MDASKSFYEYRPAAHLLVTDEDAADFLQSQFTNELRPFEVGQCTYGLWLDVKGKVLADSVVLCEGEESFRIISERCAGEAIATQMERHIIADDVEIEHREPGFALELSSQGVAALGWELPELGRFVVGAGGVLFCARDEIYNMVLDSEAVADALRRQLIAAGLTQLSEADRGLARIAAGIPLVPDEIGAADLPGEGELEHTAISFTKGCYLGQEVVARMHNVGKPQRRLFIVEGTGQVPAAPLALYNSDSKQVGELRSAYNKADGWCGVALLKTRFVGVGERLHSDANELAVTIPLKSGVENG
jgi:folate-binding protein YgfZ